MLQPFSSNFWRVSLLLVYFVLIKSADIGRTFNTPKFPSAWTLQAELRVPEAGETYGRTPVALAGRGFTTLITGYDRTNPGIYVHTTDDGFATRGRQVWTQQAKLIPASTPPVQPTDEFGRWIQADGFTVLVSAPYSQGGVENAEVDAGAVYVFNGTLRHWTQMQKLIAQDGMAHDHFGELISLHNDRLAVSAQGSVGASFHSTNNVPTVGSCYVYERAPGGSQWTRMSKLYAKDMAAGNFFSEKIGVFDDWVVSTSQNDFEPGLHSGSAYMFKQTSGKWSQQQKLMAADLIYWQPGRDVAKYERVLGVKVFANDIALEGMVLGSSYRRTDVNEATVNGVYIFQGYKNTNRWSLQQRLFTDPSDEGTEVSMPMNSTKVKIVENNLVASVYGPNNLGNSYLFKNFGQGWSLQQAVKPQGVWTEVTGGPTTDFLGFTGIGTDPDGVAYSDAPFTEPSLHGGTLFHRFRDTTLIHSRFHNGTCLLLWMSDHFLDGWDSAVLTVRSPDKSEDKFHPHCDQVDPFYVRYCPYQPEDEGVYIVKTFAAIEARFYWELSWQVQVEETGIWYKGDFSTKMRFNFNATSASFNFFDAENLISLDRPCFRCIALSTSSWLDQQTPGGDSFWPLDAWNAPFYISDLEGSAIVSMGNICVNEDTGAPVDHYQCYQRIKDGFYLLRLGGGLFGRETGLPYHGAKWKGCGAEGDDRTQLIFRIADGKCTPIQAYTYVTRCDRPPALDMMTLLGLDEMPTAEGTVAPTISVFGPEYIQYHMYDYDPGTGHGHEPHQAHNTGKQKLATGETIIDTMKANTHVGVLSQESEADIDREEKHSSNHREHNVKVGRLDDFF